MCKSPPEVMTPSQGCLQSYLLCMGRCHPVTKDNVNVSSSNSKFYYTYHIHLYWCVAMDYQVNLSA